LNERRRPPTEAPLPLPLQNVVTAIAAINPRGREGGSQCKVDQMRHLLPTNSAFDWGCLRLNLLGHRTA